MPFLCRSSVVKRQAEARAPNSMLCKYPDNKPTTHPSPPSSPPFDSRHHQLAHLRGLICANFLARAKGAHLRFALPENRVGRARRRDPRAPADFLPARRMIDLAVDLDGIHPNEVVRLDKPLRFKLLSANRARRVEKCTVRRNRHILVLCFLFRNAGAASRAIQRLLRRRLINLTIINPLLFTY